MKFKEYLQEKLQLSQYRQIVKMWKDSGVSKKFDHVFGNKDRLYEPYEGSANKIENDKAKKLEKFLNNRGYDILSYKDGTCVSFSNKNRIYKIGKLLQRYKELEKNDEIESLYKNFINDKDRALKEKYLICYSRHAYDIAGMSTDRGWQSCMTLPGDKHKPEGGQYAKYVPLEITAGTIIAYLIRENDKNIEKPIGRMLIKPYVNEMNKKMMMVACTDGYGSVPENMIEQVTEWTKKLNKKIGFGVFYFTGKEDTHVKKFTIVNYPQTIEDCKKLLPGVKVFDAAGEIVRNKELHKWFIDSKWPTEDQTKRTFKVRQVGGYNQEKFIIFDIKKMFDNLTLDEYVSFFKFGFDMPDDVGYEIVKNLKEMGMDKENEKIGEINDIRNIAHMIKEYKYSTEPELQTKDKFNLWLHSNQMHSVRNVGLYETMKKYYEKLKKIMRKE